MPLQRICLATLYQSSKPPTFFFFFFFKNHGCGVASSSLIRSRYNTYLQTHLSSIHVLYL
ncbi:unnamed protein product [Brassica rapa subsp. trilocularis]